MNQFTAAEETMPFVADLTCLRIVAMARGSWRWQNAYRVVRYRVRALKNGKVAWYAAERVTGKCSMPQLRRLGFGDLPLGSLHHRRVIDPEALAALHAGFDFRPNELISEDHCA